MGSQNVMSLSFVIPAWNEEKYIGKCLASILREAEKGEHDIEIVVVNNASEDRTRQIALEFPGVIVVDEPQKGLSQARQAGFLASSGDLIANMDADSILSSGWIEKTYEQFLLDDDLVALSGPYEYYDLSRLTNILVKLYYLPAYGLHLVTHRLLGIGAVLQGGNFVLRRTALEKIGGFNVDIQFYGEDTDIARRIQKVGKVKFLPGFKMRTSGRRLRKEGVLKTGARYTINYFWIIIFKRPFSKDYAGVSEYGNNGE